MIKILLVDSNPAIRQYICHSIDWKMLNANIIDEASNGEEAFFLAVKHSPDIIITDINLPVCDGMELISKLHSIHSTAKIIIFTEEQRTECLLQAINLSVKGYLLKQSSLSHIRIAIKNICDQIIEEQTFSNNILSSKKLFQKYLRDTQSQFMNHFFRHNSADNSFSAESAALDIHLPGPQYQIILFHCDSTYYWNILACMEQFVQALHPFMWHTQCENVYAILLNIQNENDSQSFLMNITKRYKHIFNAFDLNYILSPSKKSLQELSSYYLLGIHLSKCSILFDENEIVQTQNLIGNFRQVNIMELISQEKYLIYGLKTWGIRDYENQIQKYISLCSAFLLPNPEIQNSLYRIVFGLIAKDNMEISDMGKQIQEISQINNINKLTVFLMGLYRRFGISATYNSTLILNVRRFVEEHYAEKISLNMIAKINYTSASYLSSLFHKESGISFTQWLHSYRIERAKELLSTGKYKHYEIAAMVGYADYKTFAKYFHKYTGKNARDFKKQFAVVSNSVQK